MADKQKRLRLITPKGVAVFPRLNEPDTKYVAEGVYTVRLRVDPEAPGVQDFIGKLEELRDEVYEQKAEELRERGKPGLIKKLTKREVYLVEEDDEGNETGFITFSSRMKASGTSKKTGKPWTRKPDYFDAQKNTLKDPPSIWGGSELRLAVEPFGYFHEKDKEAGVSLRLDAVQIIKLVTGGSRDADAYGFGEEDGDDLSEVSSAEPTASSQVDGNDTDDDEDF